MIKGPPHCQPDCKPVRDHDVNEKVVIPVVCLSPLVNVGVRRPRLELMLDDAGAFGSRTSYLGTSP
jgi:hypothetical protein